MGETPRGSAREPGTASDVEPKLLADADVPWWLLGVAVVLAGAYAGSLLVVDRGEAGYDSFWDGWWYTAATFAPIPVLAARARRDRERRLAWVLLGGGILATWLADLLYTFRDQNLDPYPFIAPSDIAYLSAYPLWLAAIAVLARRGLVGAHRSTLLDALVTGAAAAAVAVTMWFGPLLALAPDDAEVALALVFSTLDVILLAAALAALLPSGRRPAPAAVGLVASFAAFAVGDVIYLNLTTRSSYETGTPIEGLWVLAIVGMGLSSWLRPTPASAVGPSDPSLGRIPTIAALISLVLLVAAIGGSIPPLAVALATGSLALALLRVLWTIAELRTINEGYQQARTDDLTGLGNRRSFLEASASWVDADEVLAVVMIDLDGFKEVNDSLGHPAGDQLLVEVGERFTAITPPPWRLARLGGDEFGLVALASEGDAVALADLLLAQLDRPIELQGIPVRVSASIGIAAAAPSDPGRSDLLRTADVAMYEAKRRGGRVVAYRPSIDPHGRARLALLDDLCQGLEQATFDLVYQPILDARSQGVVAVEALLRWDHPGRGRLAPAEFLEVARRAGLIPKITRYVLARAIGDLRPLWQQGSPVGLHVNISADDLVDESFGAVVLTAVADAGIASDLLTVEITEDELASDLDRARRTLEALRAGGVRVAIDDFGVGYSSLSQLLTLPLDQLKIDRSFISALGADPRAEAIVRSAIELGRTLGLSVVAEGVEQPTELEQVRRAGVDLVQGFGLERPVSICEVAAIVERRGVARPISAG